MTMTVKFFPKYFVEQEALIIPNLLQNMSMYSLPILAEYKQPTFTNSEIWCLGCVHILLKFRAWTPQASLKFIITYITFFAQMMRTLLTNDAIYDIYHS